MPEVPIGSIVAYAGPIDREEFEPATGWMLCDGRLLDRNDTAHAALFNAIGFAWGHDGSDRFNLPDLQGYFLRGVDESQGPESRDPDNNRRTRIHPGGSVGARVGSGQSYGKALPPEQEDRFRVLFDGQHRHSMNFEINATRAVGGTGNTVAHPAPNPSQMPQTEPVGNHNHRFEGGNKETRPINAYVNWIIRVQ